MTAAIADRVRDTTTSTGTGAIVLANSPPGGYQSFASGFPAAPVSDVMYVIADQSAGPNWEIGSGTFNGSTGLTRDTVLASSNGGSLVNFTTGTKDVFVSVPAERAVLKDANGNIVGNWIPRTGLLASLIALALGSGELASATDTPAIVQGTGAAGVNYTYFPFISTLTGSVTGTGAVNTTVPCTASIVRLTLAAAITGLTATLQNGYIDGQELQIEIVGTGTSVTSLIVNGTTITAVGGTTSIPTLISLTPTTALVMKYVWNTAGSAWTQKDDARFLRNVLNDPGAVDVGVKNLAIGAYSGAIGNGSLALQNGAYAIGQNSIAAGQSAFAIGTGALAAGTSGFALGPGTRVAADNAVAFGQNSIAFGDSSFAAFGASANAQNAIAMGAGIGGVFGGNSVSLQGGSIGNIGQAYSIASASGGLSAPSLVLNTVAGLEVGQAVMIPLVIPSVAGTATNLVYVTVNIQSINTGTKTITVNAPSVPTTVPAITSIGTGQLYETNGGFGGTAIQAGALALNQGELALSGNQNYFANAGDGQSAMDWLGIQTTDATANVVLTTNYAAVNTNIQFGNSNRFQIPANQGVVVEMTLTAKQAGASNMTTWKRRFLAANTGGTITLSALQTIGTDIGIGTTQWTTTWVATPPFTIVGNNTQTSVDVKVTGLAATTISWLATFLVPTSLTV